MTCHTGLLFLLLLGLLFSLSSDATCVNSLQCNGNCNEERHKLLFH